MDRTYLTVRVSDQEKRKTRIAQSMWADVLRDVFVPQASRLTTQQLQLKLDALHDAPKKQPPRAALRRINFD